VWDLRIKTKLEGGKEILRYKNVKYRTCIGPSLHFLSRAVYLQARDMNAKVGTFGIWGPGGWNHLFLMAVN
jgi:hypothetical protein